MKKTILFIEDNNDIRENTAEILELSGYSVLTAVNGKEGVALAIEHKPDLIICDIMMPVLDGYGVIHMLQKNPETHLIPFIFVSAKAERMEIRKGMDLGADDYITKPFSRTELFTAIESRLRKSEVVRSEIESGITGFDTLINAGKESLKVFTEGRPFNKYKKKQVIYSEENNPHRIYYVQKGKVKTYKTNNDGKELVLNLFEEGAFFGYNALLEGGSYKETAETLEESEIIYIAKEDFDELINKDRTIMQKFMKLLANDVIEKEKQLLSLAYSSLRKRVAETLISLNKRYKQFGVVAYSIDLSRENLANITGTAKESLIRTLSDFKEEKLIDITDGNITILNEKKLSMI